MNKRTLRVGHDVLTIAVAVCAAAVCAAAGVTGRASAGQVDPFAGLEPRPVQTAATNSPAPPPRDWTARLLGAGAQVRAEVFSQFSAAPDVTAGRIYSRQSLGIEALKRFSGRRETLALFDAQVRLARRDNADVRGGDMGGAGRDGWALEVHNLYADFYNVLNPFLGDRARGEQVGRFNARVGHFYLPFGLNLQTDTHGTLLQLSNEQNFGFERDWYAGFFGGINRNAGYDLYYLAGSGHDILLHGQKGLLGARLSLGSRFAHELGMEGGLSLLGGERISSGNMTGAAMSVSGAGDEVIVDTRRAGLDARYRRVIPGGTLTYSTEWSAGRDDSDDVLTQLHQVDALSRSRRWGVSAQYRRFLRDAGASGGAAEGPADGSLIAEATWYVNNDVGNANLQWVKLNVERQTERRDGEAGTIASVQYYRYW